MNLSTQTFQATGPKNGFGFPEGFSVKKVFTQWRAQNLLNKNARESIVNGFEQCLRGISGLEMTLNYLDDDVILLFGTDIPEKLAQHSAALHTIAKQNSHLYTCYMSSVSIIAKRYSAIQSIVKRILAQGFKYPPGKNAECRNLQKQLAELRRDFIILAETELLLLERVSPAFQNNSLKNMKIRLRQAA